ncbi:exoribonuclease II [Motilimonas cestriensis]|uniref:Exoribonuclease II n=1 Tax=Motilimonas cestriensis TaxID=2742685 RepID=A0ABS8W876_9GAMM|nr:exoribonuclease II [Motilimonas cestriensis]MCE2595201.1 exoribonuclease II [Motilimonas cestriensis]
MFQDNPLLAQLKQQMQSELPKKEGTIKATERGFGFLETDDKESYFIPPNEMRKVLHGDRICAIIRENGDKPTAEPESLVSQQHTEFVGKLKHFKGKLQFIAENPLFKHPFNAKLHATLKSTGLKEGDWVKASLTQHPLKDEKRFAVQVNEKIAAADDPYVGRWVTLAKLDLATTPPAPPENWSDVDTSNRVDYRHLPFFTIDNETTQDMDDALHIETRDNGWQLTIAIADPTAFIPQQSQLERIAAERGFTIYMPNFNVPMLPRELSDDLCSLKAGVERVAIVCKVNIDSQGHVTDEAQFELAIIQSVAKLSYNQVSDFIEQASTDWQPEQAIAEQLKLLEQCSAKRLAWREANALTFDDNPDYKFVLSDTGELEEILALPRRIAHRMVEEAMVLANVCGAQLLAKHQVQGVFNCQSGLQAERTKEAVALLAEQGFEATAEQLADLQQYCQIRRQIRSQGNQYLDFRLRRMFAYSEFKPAGEPHFAMGLPLYATWTSPIRKYSDLVNHYQIKSILTQQPAAELDENLGNQINEKRKKQRMAENGANAWLYAQYLATKANNGEVFNGQVIDVVRAGVRVKLLDIGAFVFIPSSFLHKDKDQLQCRMETGHVLINDQVVITQGQTLEVEIHEVNIETKNFIARPHKTLLSDV